MAGLTRQRGDKMPSRLALDPRAVVAACTGGGDTRVVEARALEGYGALVAALAWRVGDDVICRLARRGDAVVACGAAVHDPHVAHIGLRSICRPCGWRRGDRGRSDGRRGGGA